MLIHSIYLFGEDVHVVVMIEMVVMFVIYHQRNLIHFVDFDFDFDFDFVDFADFVDFVDFVANNVNFDAMDLMNLFIIIIPQRIDITIMT